MRVLEGSIDFNRVPHLGFRVPFVELIRPLRFSPCLGCCVLRRSPTERASAMMFSVMFRHNDMHLDVWCIDHTLRLQLPPEKMVMVGARGSNLVKSP